VLEQQACQVSTQLQRFSVHLIVKLLIMHWEVVQFKYAVSLGGIAIVLTKSSSSYHSLSMYRDVLFLF
jgi:hypothetical protein